MAAIELTKTLQMYYLLLDPVVSIGIFLLCLGYFVDKVGSFYLDHRWRSLYELKNNKRSERKTGSQTGESGTV